MDFLKRTIKFFSTKPNSNNERETKRRRVSNNSQKTPRSVTRSQTKTPLSVTRSQTKTPLSVTRSQTKTPRSVTRYQTKTPRSVTRYQTKTPRPNNTNNTINNNQKNVTKKKSTKPLPQKGKNRNDSTLGEQQEKRYRKIKNIIKQKKIKNIIKQKKIKIQPNSIKTNTKKANIQNIIKMFNTKSQYISNNKSENIPRALKYISGSKLVPGTSIKRQKIPFNKLNEKTSSIIKTIENASIKFNKKEIDLIASDKDKDFNIDFLFLVYLDIVHDETYTGSFNEFLKSRIAKILCKKVPKFKVTTMIGNIIKESEGNITNKNNIIKAKKGFEKILKLKLNEIFDPGWVKEYGLSTSITKKDNRLNVILDSEKQQALITSGGSGSQISALIESSKKGNERPLKPLFTLGSLFDPGWSMLQWGITRDIPNLFGKNPKTSMKWCLYTMDFNINKNTHISVGHDGKKYVLKINGEKIPIGLSKSNAQNNKTNNKTNIPIGLSKSNAQNNKTNNKTNIPIGLSKSNAQNNKTNNRKMLSKFMGDFLQNLYGVGIMYHYRNNSKKIPICLGTTDGNNTLMYAFMVHRILGQKPKIILDLSKNNEFLLYNLKDHFTILSTPTYQSGAQVRSAGKTTVQQPPKQGLQLQGGRRLFSTQLNTIPENNSVQKKNLVKTTTTKRKK